MLLYLAIIVLGYSCLFTVEIHVYTCGSSGVHISLSSCNRSSNYPLLVHVATVHTEMASRPHSKLCIAIKTTEG
jgi:hypothetical protein